MNLTFIEVPPPCSSQRLKELQLSHINSLTAKRAHRLRRARADFREVRRSLNEICVCDDLDALVCQIHGIAAESSPESSLSCPDDDYSMQLHLPQSSKLCKSASDGSAGY